VTPADEDFIHYVDCIDSLNRAWSILQNLGKVEQPSALNGAAFLFALIEYAKPYTRSEGIHGRRKLLPPELPELLALHEQILDLRNQVLAHSDLTVKQAQLHLHSFNGKPYYIASSNCGHSFPSRKVVITLIEQTLEQMYVKRN
jgi:YHS domain-containing protein